MRVRSLLLAMLVSACGAGRDKGDGGFSSELGIDPAALTSKASGLRYQDLSAGQGAEAVEGRTAVVHYTGWLTNGQ
jgi:hypothetical protein